MQYDDIQNADTTQRDQNEQVAQHVPERRCILAQSTLQTQRGKAQTLTQEIMLDAMFFETFVSGAPVFFDVALHIYCLFVEDAWSDYLV